MKLDQQIYQLRTRHGLSQSELAEQLEVSRQSVSKWETGVSVPDLDKLTRMSELFGVSLDVLVNGQEASVPEPVYQAAGRPLRQLVGLGFLGFGGLVVLLVTLFSGDLLGALVLGLPLILVGGLCLALRQPLLPCCWFLLALAVIGLPWMTGIQVGLLNLIHQLRTGWLPAGQWLIALPALALELATVLLTASRLARRPGEGSGKKLLAALAALAGLYALPAVLFRLHLDGFWLALLTIVWDLARPALWSLVCLYAARLAGRNRKTS